MRRKGAGWRLNGGALYLDSRRAMKSKGFDRPRPNRLETRLNGLATRLKGLETRLNGLETRLKGLETRLKRDQGAFLNAESHYTGVAAIWFRAVARKPKVSNAFHQA